MPAYFQNGTYKAQPARTTISNAMDVGDPSNFVRMLELFDHQFGTLKQIISSYSISDEETRQTIVKVKEKFGYLPDPHGAVAYAATERYLASHPDDKAIFLETAHPIKFYDVVEPLPESVKEIVNKEKVSTKISASFQELKNFLLNE